MFKFNDLSIQPNPEIGIHAVDNGGKPLFSSCTDLDNEPFAHSNELCRSCCQRSEYTQVLVRQPSPGFWPEGHEPGNAFGIAPVCLYARTPGKCKSLDLCWRQLRGFYQRRSRTRLPDSA
jgi:hypothetical protein